MYKIYNINQKKIKIDNSKKTKVKFYNKEV